MCCLGCCSGECWLLERVCSDALGRRRRRGRKAKRQCWGKRWRSSQKPLIGGAGSGDPSASDVWPGKLHLLLAAPFWENLAPSLPLENRISVWMDALNHCRIGLFLSRDEICFWEDMSTTRPPLLPWMTTMLPPESSKWPPSYQSQHMIDQTDFEMTCLGPGALGSLPVCQTRQRHSRGARRQTAQVEMS